MTFEFLPLRFEFTAVDSLYFPPGKAANILRGALGMLFRREVCSPDCPGAKSCPKRAGCAYAFAFEPSAGLLPDEAPAPSGFADLPRPFVFRARGLDGRRIAPGESFGFDFNLFTRRADVLAGFVHSFAALATEGLGPGRGSVVLRRVVQRDAGTLPAQILFEPSRGALLQPSQPVSLSLEPHPSAPHRIRVEFLSPVELKHEGYVVSRPDFPVLFGRIRDRVSSLSRLYGSGTPGFDFRASGDRAAGVALVRFELHRESVERRSSRTGQSHSIGGFTGWAEYEGDLAEFLPWLEAARWTGVGRQAVWGKGEIRVLAAD